MNSLTLQSLVTLQINSPSADNGTMNHSVNCHHFPLAGSKCYLENILNVSGPNPTYTFPIIVDYTVI